MKGLFLKLSSVKNISSLKSKAQGCNSFSFIQTADIIAEINIHIYFSAARTSRSDEGYERLPRASA